jgi:16S rRNA G966 N2-methylase RsmD
MIPISELKPNPKNPNKHSKEQIKRLAKILEYQGWRYPVKVSNQTGLISSGHGRVLAAKSLKETHVPVSFQDYDNEEQEYADLVADNSIASWSELDFSMINIEIPDLGPEFDIEMLGLKDFSIEVADKEGLTDEDEVPPAPKEARTKLGDLYQLGNHRLLCGDSTNAQHVERLMGGEKVDLVFTDPPYGIKIVKKGMVGASFGVAKKGNFSEIISDDTTDCAKEFYNTCKAMNLDKLIIWGGNYFTDFLPPTNSWVVWNKRADSGIVNTFADAELAWSNCGFPCRVHNQLWNGMIRSGEKDKRVHPTQKPISLASFCFDLVKDCKYVFDGFGGSGSTLIACEKTNRKCFMMELSEQYCDVIVDRWEKFTGQKAVLLKNET